MPKLNYRGIIPASKSILNRLLVIKSFAAEFETKIEIEGDSVADDVVKMKQALDQLKRGEVADCGAAGTTFRFLALRASRLPGRHVLTGSPRLFQRPQTEIQSVLSQLGCSAVLTDNRLVIEGQGWQIPTSGIEVDRTVSSQFASGLILSAWNLERALRLTFTGEQVSQGYFAMTLDLVRHAGMAIASPSKHEIIVLERSQMKVRKFLAEPDISSAFSVAALAVASGGSAVFAAWPAQSLQPDIEFIALLRRMGCRIEHKKSEALLCVEAPHVLQGISCDLANCPDLFPVLSVLCALAEGVSHLSGAPHLVFKESNRIEKSAELVRLMGGQVEMLSDGMKITPGPKARGDFTYHPEHDHRLAMAAAVARAAGYRVQIENPSVVEKSFPEFWTIAQADT